MNDIHYFCPAHYEEVKQRWGGHPENAYPGERIVIDASKCEHLNCVWTEWAEKSRQGQVCGILGCRGKPIVECPHCGNHYCRGHAFVLNTPGHPKKEV